MWVPIMPVLAKFCQLDMVKVLFQMSVNKIPHVKNRPHHSHKIFEFFFYQINYNDVFSEGYLTLLSVLCVSVGASVTSTRNVRCSKTESGKNLSHYLYVRPLYDKV